MHIGSINPASCSAAKVALQISPSVSAVETSASAWPVLRLSPVCRGRDRDRRAGHQPQRRPEAAGCAGACLLRAGRRGAAGRPAIGGGRARGAPPAGQLHLRLVGGHDPGAGHAPAHGLGVGRWENRSLPLRMRSSCAGAMQLVISVHWNPAQGTESTLQPTSMHEYV